MSQKTFIVTIFGIALFAALVIFCRKNIITTSNTMPKTHEHHHHCNHHSNPCTQESNPHEKSARPLTVIFDLNGVLFAISRRKALSQLGFGHILSYMVAGNSSKDLERTMFRILYRLEDQAAVKGDGLIAMHQSRALPSIMCKWFKGMVSGQEIARQLEPHLEYLDDEGFFGHKHEKKLIKKVINIFFNPDVRCKLCKPIKQGINLLKKCKKAGHSIYLLSNIDTEFIVLLQQKYPDIFALFDGIVASADVGMMKPDATIFEHTMATFNLDPERCYFIDDQQENIKGAQQAGIQGILFNQTHYRTTYQELSDLGVIEHNKRYRKSLKMA